MERHLRPYALSRRACETRDPSSCRYFSCVDARLCAVKENEVDERGKVRNRIPRRIDDEKAASHLHDSRISINIELIVIVIFFFRRKIIYTFIEINMIMIIESNCDDISNTCVRNLFVKNGD